MTRFCLTLIVLFLAACSAPETGEAPTDDAGTDSSDVDRDAQSETSMDAGPDPDGGDPADASDQGNRVRDASQPDLGPLGGDRPVSVILPTDYDEGKAYPVVMLLHGYKVTAALQNAYFRTSTLVDEYQFILVMPDGTEDEAGDPFWNAMDVCCDFYGSGVDDSTYLRDVLDDVLERYAADPQRIYLLGHSNGGYMSYRMACDHDDRIAAIASLAGSSWWDASECAATDPVGVLQIHGTADAVVPYLGVPNSYPAADDLASRWGDRDACATGPATARTANYDTAALGDETEVERWEDCADDVVVELWTMTGSGHIPSVDTDFTRDILDFLFQQRL
jgi:polyhydroxybutyrate depolymerase